MLNTLFQEAQTMLDRFRWQFGMEPDDLLENGDGRIAIVGAPGAGKKTLYNSLCGWEVFAGELQPVMTHNFGLFTLADVPADPMEADALLFRLENAALVVYVLDGLAGLRPEDFQWIARLRSLGGALVVALNKADELAADQLRAMQTDLEKRLAMPVVTLAATDRDAVHERFLPVMLKSSPQLAVPLASEITSLRPRVARNLVQQTTTISWLLSLEPAPMVDVSVLMSVQLQLVKRLGAVYGGRHNGLNRIVTLATMFSLATRYIAQAASKYVPFAGWLAAAFICAMGTWLLGWLALAYYEVRLPFWKPEG